jgi:phospholipase/carboxylesterase
METTLSPAPMVWTPTVRPRPGERPPLLIPLHGVGANGQRMARLAPELDPRPVVVSARSPIVLGPNAFGWLHVSFTAQGPVIVEEEARVGWQGVARSAEEVTAA